MAGYPQAAHCAEKAGVLIEQRLGGKLTKEEQLYLMLHVNRISELAEEAQKKAIDAWNNRPRRRKVAS